MFGAHDRHLAQIEQGLGVVITPRGNRLAIEGSQTQSATASDVLQKLYKRLVEGLEVGEADVAAALRWAQDGGGDSTWLTSKKGPVIRTKKKVISARSPAQAKYIESLLATDLTVGLGPAGTGKTYLAVAAGVSLMLDGKVDRLILSRPAVEAGERLGFLPGDMKDKVDPYLRPLYDALFDMLPGDQVERRIESQDIEVAPLAFMRGRTLTNAFVILDEAQNTTPMQMKMFLTRLGENSRMAVTGDPTQVDLPAGTVSGLADAHSILDGMKGVSIIRFDANDVVRHGLVTRIVAAYNARDAARKGERESHRKAFSTNGGDEPKTRN